MKFSIYLNRCVLIMIEILVFNANRVDPDQMPQNVASDLDLHCLLMFLLWNARHTGKWVNSLPFLS